MQQAPARKRTKGSTRDGTRIKDKFLEQREEKINNRPLVPMNDKQKRYIELLEDCPVVVASGYAGSSKTFIPTVMASDLFALGEINKIMVTRPALSSSKSVGFFTGNASEKMSVWLGPVTSIFKDRLGVGVFEQALARQDIEFVPLEVIKGTSIENAWLLVEEASDLTKEEVIKLITRMGKNSKLVLAGDIRQHELKEESGLSWLCRFLERNESLNKNFGWIDFDSTDDIVRSDAVKQFIVALVREEKKGLK